MKHEEIECRSCSGRGYNLLKDKRGNETKAQCGACRGHGCTLRYTGQPLFRTEHPLTPTFYDEAANWPRDSIQMPVIDPQGAQRREYALKTAMAAFQMCNGSQGMWGGRGDGEMQPEEIVPLARDIERFLGGD